MIKLSEQPQRLLSLFFAYRNDIDIYTEDENKDKEFYKFLFKKLIKDSIKINDVTPLGCRRNVINRCINDHDNGRKKLFIIDGDVFLIHGKDIPPHPDLFVLDSYCIENFLFEKESVLQYIYQHCATVPIEEIESQIQYHDWLETYATPFISLFIQFALCDFFDVSFKLKHINQYCVSTNSIHDLSAELINKDIENMKMSLLKKYETDEGFPEKYSKKEKELKEIWIPTVDNFLKIVSGKQYTIPLLNLKTNLFRKNKINSSLEESKLILLRNCSLLGLEKLKNRIESLAS